MAAYTVRFLPSASSDLDDISDKPFRRIRDAIAALADNPRPPGSLKMAGAQPY